MSLADYLIHLPAKSEELPQTFQELESCLPYGILPPELLMNIWRYVKWANVSKKLNIWLSRHCFKDESQGFILDNITCSYWRSPKARKTFIVDWDRRSFVTLVSKYQKFLGVNTNVLSCEYSTLITGKSYYPNMHFSANLDLLEPETLMMLIVMAIVE